jgi:hypothetical protein
MEFPTLRHIRALASKRGFSITLDDTIVHIVHKHCEQIQSSFDLSDPFRIDPALAQQFAFTRAYYWMRGYDLSYADNAKVLMRRGRSHPSFDQRYPREQLFDYQSMPLLQHEIAVWYYYMETHPVLIGELLAASH